MSGGGPFGYLVLDPDGSDSVTFTLVDRIFVGRECAGVDDSRRILVGDDLAVSRNHLEIRVDVESAQAIVIDTSSNGTRVNGIRIERAVGIPLNEGDRIQIGDRVIAFHGEVTVMRATPQAAPRATVSVETPLTMVMVMGDVINYSTVSEQADQAVLARDVDRLYRHLGGMLREHRGTLIDYVGDAFFAGWELEADPDAVNHALEFTLDAVKQIPRWVADFELRYADGSTLRMGWGLTLGQVVLRLMPGSVVMAIGDAVNLGFRISALAGREDRPSVLVTQAVRDGAKGPFRFGTAEAVTVKGRVGIETIYGVSTE